jgi:hypothetical protein
MSAVGNKWTVGEEEQLVSEVKEGLSIEQIASNHNRNTGGIKSRIYMIAIRMSQTRDLSDVCNELKLTVDEVVSYKTRELERNTTKQQSNGNKKPNVCLESELDVLKQIRNILLRLETKLDAKV